MKAILSIFSILIAASTVMAADPGSYRNLTEQDYRCLANALSAYNGSVFSVLSDQQLDAMLNNPQEYGHDVAVVFAADPCEIKRSE